MKFHVPAAMRLFFFCFIFSLFLSGCSLSGKDDQYTSRGVDDGINGFLFNFDQRDEVKSLVQYKGKNEYPVKVSWTYGVETMPEAESEALTEDADISEISESTEEYTETDLPEDTAEIEENTPKGVLSSEDPDLIREVYFALSNTIILGVDNNQKEDPHFYIAFTLPDGTECRFSFISETSIQISSQNYIVESDGTLWKALSN